MHEDQKQVVNVENGTPRWIGLVMAALAILTLVAMGIGWNTSKQVQAAQKTLAAQSRAVTENDAVFSKRFEQAEATNAQLQAQLGVITDRLKLTQGELSRARKQAKQIREDYAKNLGEVEAAVRAELAGKASAEDLKLLSGDLTGVRGDLDATRRDLGMARGEFGTLIARNHEEIEQLRRLGERDYLEFTLDKKGDRERLGNITVELRGANPRKSSFTVALYVDDKRLEKKNRAANEPIYFYTRGARQPLELVINEVAKNKVTGYLSVPKNAPASSGGAQ